MALKPAALPNPPPALSADEAEARFYAALQQGQIEPMMALWADEDDIVCVHPGGPRLVGLAAIRAGFEAVFAQGGVPVQPEQVHRLQWLGGALHHLAERITAGPPSQPQTAWVLATNVYVKGALGWQMVAHHASPALPQAPTLGSEAPATLH
jgi:ketosteroid isomerase-like protein